MKLPRSLYARPEFVPRTAMHQGATPSSRGRSLLVTPRRSCTESGHPLSAQPPRFAMRSLVWASQQRLLSWGDVVRSMVLEGTVWGPHSLHTPEVTPQRPDLRQEVGPAAAIRRTTRTQPAIARVGQHPKPHPPALRGVCGARWGSNTRYCAPPHDASAGFPLGPSPHARLGPCHGVPASRVGYRLAGSERA